MHFTLIFWRFYLVNSTFSLDFIPASVRARGEKALAAYNKALENGRTYDRRVKVLLVGQDRVGKTSLSKNLRGEPFDESEPSTEGVTMIPPVKNAGTDAWRNPAHLEDTDIFDHKMAAKIIELLLEKTPEPSVESPMEADVAEDLDTVSDEVVREDGNILCFNPVIIFSVCLTMTTIVELLLQRSVFRYRPTTLTSNRAYKIRPIYCTRNQIVPIQS